MTDKWPLVSVIVHNFKGTEKLRKCLSSLKKCNYANFEVIVVDCMTKEISGVNKEHFPDVKLLHFDYDEGIPARFKAAFEAINAKSKYVAFIAEDTEVNKDWLRYLVQVMEKDPKIGVAQFRD